VAAILAVGRVGTALRLASGAPAEYPVLTLTLSCDHRVVDGAVAARFLGELAEALENPLVLLD
jgi:pyruvate dehydrogenase E2 component (dihydrolipoamide acetyltransferase)